MTDDRALLAATAESVAEALEGFSVDTSWDNSWNVPLNGPNGARIFLSLDRGRVEVGGAYPDGYYQALGSQERHEITVALSRGPVTIAREIVRRLLPGYLATLAEVQEKMRLDQEAKDMRQVAAERLAEVLSIPGVHLRDGELSWFSDTPAGYGSARVNYGGGTAAIEARSVTLEVAERILCVLAEAAGD